MASPSPSPTVIPSAAPASALLTSGSREPIDTVNAFLEDVLARRGSITVSGNPNRFGIEMAGGHVVEMTPFEPDAATYRNSYYYNTASNILMRKVVIATTPIPIAYWKQISN